MLTRLGLVSIASLVLASPAFAEEEYVPEPLPKLGPFAAIKEITASSTFVDKSKRDLYGAWRVLEYELTDPMAGVPRTAWCEGKPDEGIGEGITITFLAPTKLRQIDIAAGVWLTEKLYKANNRITSLAISIDGSAPKKVAPPAEHGEWLEVPIGKAVTTIKIAIDAVTKGKMNDSCISAVSLMGDGDLALEAVRGLDAKAVAALPAAYAAIEKALTDPKHTGLDKLITFPFFYEDSSWFVDGSNRTRQKLANAKALETACKKKTDACPGLPTTRGPDDPAHVKSDGVGAVMIMFPASREVLDTWHLVWKGGAWKMTAADYLSP
ncbi:MAG: hypothetical protein AB7T06_20335 [Kofleriaceae bacterium]